MKLRTLTDVLPLAVIAALVTAVTLFEGIRDGFVTTVFTLGFVFPAVVQRLPDVPWIALSVSSGFAGLHYFFSHQESDAHAGIVLAASVALSCAITGILVRRRRLRSH